MPIKTDVLHLVRAPVHYAPHLRCLLGDVLLAQATWDRANSDRAQKWRHIREAIGAWLKYQAISQAKIFDEIKQTLGDALFLSSLDPDNPPKPMNEIRLPTLNEWIIKRKLGVHRQDPLTFTRSQVDAIRADFVPGLDFGPPLITESELDLLYQGRHKEPLIQAHIERLAAEYWLEKHASNPPKAEGFHPNSLDGLGGSYWRRETQGSLQAMLYECQQRLLSLVVQGEDLKAEDEGKMQALRTSLDVQDR